MTLTTDLTKKIDENWDRIRSEISERWSQLTQDDLQMIDGDSRKLIALVHQKTGLRLDEIEAQIDQIAADSSGLLSRVTQSASHAIEAVSESVNETASSAVREIKHRVVADTAKSTAVTFGVGFLIGFCAVGLLGQQRR